MRIILGGISQEQNTFSPVLTAVDDFESRYLLRGQEVLDRLASTGSEIAGAMCSSQEEKVELIPTLWGQAVTAGLIRRDAYAQLKSELMQRIRAAGDFDGIYLCLHGATSAEGEPDVAGDLIAEARSIAGKRPVAASLDMHANITQRMIEHATVLVGYHRCPHTDQFETGYRAVQLLVAAIRGDVKPVIAYRRIPLLHAPEVGGTDQGPLAELLQEVLRAEAVPGILHVAIYPVQPWLDVPELGTCAVVVADDRPDLAREHAGCLARLTWQRRHELVARLVPVREAIHRAASMDSGPVVFSDAGDNPGGGGTGDSTAILRGLLETGIPCSALLTIVDPEAVTQAIAAGIGSEITLDIGGKIDIVFGRPVRVTGRVRTIFDGEFVYKSAALRGSRGNMGRTVVLQIDKISVVLAERSVIHVDPVTYESVGLDVGGARIVQAKSMMGFTAAYAPIAREIIWVATPGLTTSDYGRLPFRVAPRPLFPVDEVPDEAVLALSS